MWVGSRNTEIPKFFPKNFFDEIQKCLVYTYF